MTTISVLGLGAMGSALATVFLDRGHHVTVWNRSPEKARAFSPQAPIAASARDAVEASPVTVICVLDYPAARAVLETTALAGRVIVNLTNGTPEEARALDAWVTSRGAAYIDGAVMVTPDMVGGAHASLLYSGDRRAYTDHEATLAALGAGTFFEGEVGLAALYDLALLAAMFGMFGGFLHAAALLRSQERSVEAAAPMITALLHAMVDLLPETARQVDTGEPTVPTSNNAMMAIGARNVREGSREQGVQPDLVAPIVDLFERGVAAGLGHRDLSALAALLRA